MKLPPVEHNAAQIILIDFDVCCTKFWIVNADNFLISLSLVQVSSCFRKADFKGLFRNFHELNDDGKCFPVGGFVKKINLIKKFNGALIL